MHGFPEFKNLVDMALQQAQNRPDATASTFLTDNGQIGDSQTFLGLDSNARKVAMELVNKGLAGRNVLLLYPPGIDYIRAFFGCLYAGCVPVPAYPPVGSKDLVRLQKVAQDCQAGAVLSNTTLAPMIENWISNLSYQIDLPCIATDPLLLRTLDSGFTPHQAQSDDVAFLQYTSGSTGHPKGVEVSHGNLLANFKQILCGFFNGNTLVDQLSDLKVVIWLPPFHDMGLIGGVLTPIFAGAHVSLMSPLTFLKRPLLWLQTISQQQAHVSGGPNFAYQYCVRKVSEEQAETLDLSNWQVAFNGAEPVQTSALTEFAERFRVSGFQSNAYLPCYGLAEACLFVAGSPSGRGAKVLRAKLDRLEQGRYEPSLTTPSNNVTELVSSGVVAIGTEVRIVNPQTLRQCKQGEVGEIWINGPSIAKGYWEKPQFSASVFRATIANDDSQTAYLRSGDLGLMWENELFVTGRIKEVIILSGRNHYPQDIEQTLQESNPTFRKGNGAAFSITENGKEQLVIIQEVNRAGGDQTDYRLLAAEGARAITARHGVTPMALILMSGSAIPKTSSGKIQRSEARQMYQEGNFAPVYLWKSSTIESNQPTPENPTADNTSECHFDTDWHATLYCDVQTWVASKLDIEPHHIDLDVTFSELGVDSVESVELIDRLQDRIERVIPAIELLRYPTVKALIEHFANELEEKSLQHQLKEDEDVENNEAVESR